jgi:hypothetical protein
MDEGACRLALSLHNSNGANLALLTLEDFTWI